MEVDKPHPCTGQEAGIDIETMTDMTGGIKTTGRGMSDLATRKEGTALREETAGGERQKVLGMSTGVATERGLDLRKGMCPAERGLGLRSQNGNAPGMIASLKAFLPLN